jgi:hypothetical protein
MKSRCSTSRYVHGCRYGRAARCHVKILSELYAGNGQIGVIASERFDINVHSIGSAAAAGHLSPTSAETS